MEKTSGVYRCPCCGCVIEEELRWLAPFCCGVEMTRVSQHGEHVVVREKVVVPARISHNWAKTVGRRAMQEVRHQS